MRLTGAPSDDLALSTRRSVNRLADVVRLRESAAVVPRDHVADFKARILDRDGHAVIGARSEKATR
jgi:hypothetical protein